MAQRKSASAKSRFSWFRLRLTRWLLGNFFGPTKSSLSIHGMRGMENVRHDCFLDRARRFFGRHPWSSAGKERPVERLTEKIARLGFAPTPAPRSRGSRRPKTGADHRLRIWEC